VFVVTGFLCLVICLVYQLNMLSAMSNVENNFIPSLQRENTNDMMTT
jgi:hypothetical protein